MKSLTSIIDLDHIMMCVHDHARTLLTFERLGFVVRPVRENAPMGGASAGGKGGSAIVLLFPKTANAANFIGLSYADPRTAHPVMKEILGGPEGFGMLVHSTVDADLLYSQWTKAGIDLEPLWTVDFPGIGGNPGYTGKIIMPKPGTEPFLCGAVQFGSMADFEVEDLRAHPNTAKTWTVKNRTSVSVRILRC